MRPTIRSSTRARAAVRVPFASIALLFVVLQGSTFLGCGRGDVLEEVRANQAAGRYQETVEPLRALLAEDRDAPEVNYRYGLALTMLGQPSLAEWSLRKAMKDPEWRVPAANQLAQGALVSQNFDTALEAINIVVEAEPENIEALMMRANTLAHSKLDYVQALADADRMLELDPDFLEAYEPKVLSLIGLERFDEVGAAIEEMGERMKELELADEQLAWQCATLAVFADDSQEEALARERWEACLEAYPGAPDVVWPAIKFYDARYEFARSREILEVAVETEDALRDYRPSLAARLRAEGRVEEAEARLREAMESEDVGARILGAFDLVKHYQEIGQYAEAAEAARLGVTLSEELGRPAPQLLLEQADSLLLAGEYDQALAVADSMEVEPHRELIRARIAQERGDPETALAHFDEAFRLWPNNPWARYAAAGAAESIGDFDRALEEYRYSIRIDPVATDARVQVARLLLAEGKAAEALQLIQIRNAEDPVDLPGQLVLLEALGGDGRLVQAQQLAQRLGAAQPGMHAACVAAVARGLHAAGGTDAAIQILQAAVLNTESAAANGAQAPPAPAAALRTLIEIAHDAGRLDEARPAVAHARSQWPRSGAIRAAEARLMALDAAPVADVQAAYQDAITLSPEDAYGWLGLGRAFADSDPSQALAAFDRALSLDPEVATEAQLAAAAVLVAQGDRDGAAARLTAALESDPYSADAARMLAGIRLEQGQVGSRTTRMAQRAVRFGRGSELEEARALLERAEAAQTSQAGADPVGEI